MGGVGIQDLSPPFRLLKALLRNTFDSDNVCVPYEDLEGCAVDLRHHRRGEMGTTINEPFRSKVYCEPYQPRAPLPEYFKFAGEVKAAAHLLERMPLLPPGILHFL